MWIKEESKQYITFVDPKGIIMLSNFEHPKIKLAETIKSKQNKLESYGGQIVILNSFLVSNTNFNKAREAFNDPYLTKDDFVKMNIIFQEDKEKGIDKMFKKILEIL